MTQIDFYILDSGVQGNRYTLACRVAEKAWQQGHRVLINTASCDEANHLNRLLWTFRDQSFVPHGALGEVDSTLNPVLVGVAPNAGDEHDVLVNLAVDVPGYFSRFQRVAECVDQDQTTRQQSRERFRYYRDRGYSLHSHKVGRSQ